MSKKYFARTLLRELPHEMVEYLGASDVIDMVLTVTWLLELLEAHRAT
jgi:hypothetical protein